MGQFGLALIDERHGFEDFELTLQALLGQAPAHTKANLLKEIAQHRYAFGCNSQN